MLSQQLFSAFSIKNNLKSLFQRQDNQRFQPLDGLRAIAVFWLIGFHSLFMLGFYYPINQFKSLLSNPSMYVFQQGHMGVDIFFVISGFLIGYLLLTELEQTRSIHLGRFYTRRALRILPAYFMSMLILALLIPQNIENAWFNVIFLNNFLPTSDQYMAWAWSLAIEEQFYTVAPLLLLVLHRNFGKHLLTILLMLFLLSFVIRWIVQMSIGLSAPLAIHPKLDWNQYQLYYDNLYDKPHTRFGGLLIGVLAARLYQHKSTRQWFSDNRQVTKIFYILSILVIMMFLFIPVMKFNQLDSFWFQFNTLAYRNLFSLAIAFSLLYWLVLPSDNQSWLANMLSAPFWYPLAQLSYSVFLLHLIVIQLMASSVFPSTTTPGPAQVGLLFLLFSCISTFAALLMYLLIEKPFMNVRRFF